METESMLSFMSLYIYIYIIVLGSRIFNLCTSLEKELPIHICARVHVMTFLLVTTTKLCDSKIVEYPHNFQLFAWTVKPPYDGHFRGNYSSTTLSMLDSPYKLDTSLSWIFWRERNTSTALCLISL